MCFSDVVPHKYKNCGTHISYINLGKATGYWIWEFLFEEYEANCFIVEHRFDILV
jgi:hypothetical protein